jgi:hypothetical protein
VRYIYDEKTARRLKTVELIIESVPWRPRPRRLRRTDDEIVAVRIAFHETDLRERAKRLGAVWRPSQKLWELKYADAKRLASPPASNNPITLPRPPQTYARINTHLPLDVCIH